MKTYPYKFFDIKGSFSLEIKAESRNEADRKAQIIKASKKDCYKYEDTDNK